MFSHVLSTKKWMVYDRSFGGEAVGRRVALMVRMDALVITTTAAGALGIAYGIQKAALNLLFRMMSLGQRTQ